MADIINLNKARKAKTKQRQKLQAVENRVVHGVSTKTRALEKERRMREVEKIGGHLLNSEELNKKS